MPKIDQEQKELIKKAQEQPGIKELMITYGHYEELIEQSNKYFAEILPKSAISTTNNTTY